jgi:regulator of protease activity HflC (stomatin/prohibitin superfamily)
LKNIAIILAAAIAVTGCTQVDNGNAAVKTYYGQAEQKSYGPGLYWYNPWSTDIISMNTQQNKWGDKTETYTKDVQKADVTFVLNYHLSGDRAHVMYQRVGTDWADNILPQATVETIKDELGRVDAVTLVATRGDVAQRIYMKLRAKLARQDVVLDSFDLTDISYTQAFEHAVEQKQVAVQAAITAKNQTVQVQEEANQAVIAAKGKAEALSITSTALKGDPKLIEYEAIKKWDGTLPTYMTGNVPFVKVGQ